MNRKNITVDGNTAAAHVAYAFSEVAPIYPITPSTTMAELMDKWSAEGKLNLFGHRVKLVQMQSEAGVAGTLHGNLAAGLLASTFTASQGLLLMIPNMFKIAGELLPAVFYVSARTVATHALSIFGDHSDIYSCRQTGCAILAEGNVQEVADLSVIAHLAAVKGSLPFINFFDGFNTSHELQNIKMWQESDIKEMLDLEAIGKFRARALNPQNPTVRGTAQNPDTFFQNREAANGYYNRLPKIVQNYMTEFNNRFGTHYSLFNYYGAPDATNVIVAMGSVCDTIEEVVDYLNKQGRKCGLIKVRLFRPFSVHHFMEALPKTTKTLTVLDRTKEPGAVADPLFLDVAAALQTVEQFNVKMYGGRYGLSSKDTGPEQIISVFENAEKNNKKFFTIGILDDVTNLSLPEPEVKFEQPNEVTCCKFWGFGSDGTVSACKNIIKIIGGSTNNFVRGFFSYDSKKSSGVTVSYIRFSIQPIKSAYAIKRADFIACHQIKYLQKYKIVEELKPNGILLLSCNWAEWQEKIPNHVKKYIAQNNIKLFVINADQLANNLGLANKPSVILQAAFFKLINILPEAEAKDLMKKTAKHSFSNKGKGVVEKNYAAIDAGLTEVQEIAVPQEWCNLVVEEPQKQNKDDNSYFETIAKPVGQFEGEKIPVSAFLPFADGVIPTGTSKYEKRGVAQTVPHWKGENCISCNLCSLVCPHAAIRPVVLNAEEEKNAPQNMQLIPLAGFSYKFGITVSALDCMGCGSCINVCPGKQGAKALEFRPALEELDKQQYFDYGTQIAPKADVLEKLPATNARNSQFRTPLLEFSGACAGCGETPYAKLVTQLFGSRLIIANATGCSSIWGASSPTTPYTQNHQGKGPAWANSLFEDNAEFGYGIWLAQNEMRQNLIFKCQTMVNSHAAEKEAILEFIDTKDNAEANEIAANKLINTLKQGHCNECDYILKNQQYLLPKSVWLFGGDGWAYDIGFSGLDHVMSTNANINALVFDTEVYSNTGGQSSKATPLGAFVKFAAGGKKSYKKNLAEMIINYGHVYVAQIALGADYNQAVRALCEAESYNGPSLVIVYAPCISHGIKTSMGSAQTETKLAVEAGYWNLFRYDPRKKLSGQNPFMLDSCEPKIPLEQFLSNELRYSLINKEGPELMQKLQNNVYEQYKKLKQLADANS